MMKLDKDNLTKDLKIEIFKANKGLRDKVVIEIMKKRLEIIKEDIIEPLKHCLSDYAVGFNAAGFMEIEDYTKFIRELANINNYFWFLKDDKLILMDSLIELEQILSEMTGYNLYKKDIINMITVGAEELKNELLDFIDELLSISKEDKLNYFMDVYSSILTSGKYYITTDYKLYKKEFVQC